MFSFGYLYGIFQISGYYPDVLATAPVRGEDDPLPVRAVAGLGVEGHAVGQAPRLPALDGHLVEIAQQVEDDPLAARMHINRHPRALGEGAGEHALGSEGEAVLKGFEVTGMAGLLGSEGARDCSNKA